MTSLKDTSHHWITKMVVLTQDYRVAIVWSQLCSQTSYTWPCAAQRNRLNCFCACVLVVVLVDQFYSTSASLQYANFSHFTNVSLFCVSLLKVTLFFQQKNKISSHQSELWVFWGNCVTDVGYNTLFTTSSNKYCLQVLTSNNSSATVKFTTLLGHLTFTWHLTFLEWPNIQHPALSWAKCAATNYPTEMCQLVRTCPLVHTIVSPHR